MQGFLIHFLVKQNFCLMIDKWDVTIYFFNITCHSNSFLRPTTKQNTEECIDSVYCLFIINACMFQSYSHLSSLIYTASCLMYNALCHPHLTHLVDSNWLSNMPHQNTVLHSYTHTMELHTIPDKCNLQWSNKYGYNLPYRIFIPEILLLNWSCLCCTRLTHHEVHQTGTDRNSTMFRRHYNRHAQNRICHFLH